MAKKPFRSLHTSPGFTAFVLDQLAGLGDVTTRSMFGGVGLVAYLLVRKYGGPGAEKLAAGLALFGAVDSIFVYKSADWWRAVHPQTSVVPNLMASGSKMGPLARLAFSMSAIGFIFLVLVLLTVRVRLADQQAALDQLYHLAEED